MSDSPLRVLLPDATLPDCTRTAASLGVKGGRVWLSPAMFIALPNDQLAGSILVSHVQPPHLPAPALELRCPHPAGVPWMTLEFMFGAEATAAIRGAGAIGLRLRAKALPPMTVLIRCAFVAGDATSIIEIEPGITLTHDFALVERELTLDGTPLAGPAAVSELRFFLALPQAAYFALAVTHAELYSLPIRTN